MALYVHSKKKQGKNTKEHNEREERRRKEKKRKKYKNEKRSKHALKAQAESRGQGCCLLERSVVRYTQLMDQHKDATPSPDGRQEDKERVETKSKQTQKTSSPTCPVGGSRTTQPTRREDRDRRTKKKCQHNRKKTKKSKGSHKSAIL